MRARFRFGLRAAAALLCGLMLVCGSPLWAAPLGIPAGAPPPDAAAGLTRLKQLLGQPGNQEMLELLAAPEVREKLMAETPAVAPHQDAGAGELLAAALTRLRARLLDLGVLIGGLGGDIADLRARTEQAGDAGAAQAAALFLVLFLIGGIGLEALFFRLTTEWRNHVRHASLKRLRERAAIAAQRLAYALLLLVCFSAGSFGPYLLFHWPPPLGTIILDYLIALIEVRFCLAVMRFVLAPGAEPLRLVPLSTPDASFWYRAGTIAAWLAAFGTQSLSVLDSLGASAAERDAFWLVLGLAIVGFGLLLALFAWLGRRFGHAGPLHRTITMALVVLGLPLVWLAFVANLDEIGWLLVVAGIMPPAIYVARHIAASIVRGPDPAAGDPAAAHPADGDPRTVAVMERAARNLVLVLAALALAHAWHLDVAALADSDSPAARLARGTLEATIILLTADLAWHIVKVPIDHWLETPDAPNGSDDGEAHRRARIRTLLPVLRSTLLITLLSLASMSALSALGVQIGPLLAGAGIVGIALGLGAQALVRDVISGVFFLLDDAFRIGEYVETGAIAGTVEAFSLRSIKLRHYKGLLHTIPFGSIKSVTNYSRSWMAAELELLLAYDTDLALLDAAIGDVSQALAQDPALAGSIVEPLKSLGITAMTESAIKVTLLIKVKAGEQFLARRLAYARIKTLFDARGLAFAVPRLQIGRQRPDGTAVPSLFATGFDGPEAEAPELGDAPARAPARPKPLVVEISDQAEAPQRRA